jgi:ABC-type nitrate/sulfonate/bicarbonate transport system substrate-binding protein
MFKRPLALLPLLLMFAGCGTADQETTGSAEPPAATDAAPRTVAINFPTRSGASWPLFIAKEGGYYQKYGIDASLAFGAGNLGVAMISSGEAVMTNSSMEQALQASSRDPGALVSMGSSLNKGTLSLMAAKGIGSIAGLKGKRIAVSQVGDAPYNYTLALLRTAGLADRDVTWIPAGVDAAARAAALESGRADATLLTAPMFFRMEEQGFSNLGNLADFNNVYASTVYLFTRETVNASPDLPERLIRAHSEAIKRFYDDKAFAVQAYLAYDKQNQADVERIYDLYAKNQSFERIPYVLADAVQSVVNQANEQSATQMKGIDFRTVVDNGVVDRLVQEGFFVQLFGEGIRAEQEARSRQALR